MTKKLSKLKLGRETLRHIDVRQGSARLTTSCQSIDVCQSVSYCIGCVDPDPGTFTTV
jgi:hypothetical protein